MATNIIDAVNALEAGKTLTIAKDAAGNKVAHKVTLSTTAVTAEKQELEYTKTSAGKMEVDVNDMCFVDLYLDGVRGAGNDIMNNEALRSQLTCIMAEAFGNGNNADGAYEGPADLVLPNCIEILVLAFCYCDGLGSISLPVATDIYLSAFEDCCNLTSISIPSVVNIGNCAFYLCYGLTSISLPAATSIGDSAFCYCDGLTSISLPVAISIENNAFFGCSEDLVIDLSENTNFSRDNEAQYREEWGVPENATIIFYNSDYPV